ncbi:OsmC family protein [Salinarimonas sp.]|uniref:OsmC family protein n=1 Tax=Salinarimonas sp. TaxID=2766526 RepID=UPI0032D96797
MTSRSAIRTRIVWTGETRMDGAYSRGHLWMPDGGHAIKASASPHLVPIPHADPLALDPEEALLGALASCHMLFFLHLASQEGLVVRIYEDAAEGRLATDADGGMSLAWARLSPSVDFEAMLGDDALVDLHARAHARCIVARSLRTRVEIAPRPATTTLRI